jgi:glycosyltransferase involved in cell wall biosynthesis
MYETLKRLPDKHTFDVYTFSSANHDFADLRPFAREHQIFPFERSRLLESPLGRINMALRRQDILRMRRLTAEIASEIEQHEYDVVFVNPCQVETSPSILDHLTSTPSMYYCQEPPRILYETMPERPYDQKSSRREFLDKIDPLPNWYYNTLKANDRRNFAQADLVLVNSNFMRENILRVYGSQASVCYLGTDADFFQPQEIEKQRVLLSVGSLTPLKNFDFIIRALATIPATDRPDLWIASNFQNPPERDFLENLAGELGVRLTLHGNVSDEDLARLYNTAAVTVYTPIREPFGLVPLESMACGTPVVAVREGGMQETILDGQTGFLVERNLEDFAQAVMRLYCQPEMAAEFGAAGREHVRQHWTWDKAAERLEEYLRAAGRNN